MDPEAVAKIADFLREAGGLTADEWSRQWVNARMLGSMITGTIAVIFGVAFLICLLGVAVTHSEGGFDSSAGWIVGSVLTGLVAACTGVLAFGQYVQAQEPLVHLITRVL